MNCLSWVGLTQLQQVAWASPPSGASFPTVSSPLFSIPVNLNSLSLCRHQQIYVLCQAVRTATAAGIAQRLVRFSPEQGCLEGSGTSRVQAATPGCSKGGIYLNIHGDKPNYTSHPSCLWTGTSIIPQALGAFFSSTTASGPPWHTRAGFQGQYLLIAVTQIYFPSLQVVFYLLFLPSLIYLEAGDIHSSRKAADRFSIISGTCTANSQSSITSRNPHQCQEILSFFVCSLSAFI